MKKIISALLSAVLILSACVFVSFAEDPLLIKVEVPEIHEGDTEFTASVLVSSIPESGVSGIKITINYDPSLEVVSGSNGNGEGENMFGPMTEADGATPGKLNYAWVAGTTSLVTDFLLCSVSFKLPEGAKVGDTWGFDLTVEEDDVFDIDLKNVPFTTGSAVAVMTDAKALGDINGDGKWNAKDVAAFLQHSAGWSSATFIEANADYNQDGKVNMKDVSAMMTAIAKNEFGA